MCGHHWHLQIIARNIHMLTFDHKFAWKISAGGQGSSRWRLCRWSLLAVEGTRPLRGITGARPGGGAMRAPLLRTSFAHAAPPHAAMWSCCRCQRAPPTRWRAYCLCKGRFHLGARLRRHGGLAKRLGESPFAEATPNGAEACSKRSWLTTEATMRCDARNCAGGSLVVMSCRMCIRKGGVGPMQSNVI